MADQELLKIIKQAARDKMTKLDLSSKVISEPAASICETLTDDTSDRHNDLEVNSVEPNTSQPPQTENLSSTSDKDLLSTESTDEAIETPEVSQQNSLSWSEIPMLSVAEVIEELYGELDESDVREVKPKVLNELSRGHRTGRFSRVPDEIGLYTWDTKLLQHTSTS